MRISALTLLPIVLLPLGCTASGGAGSDEGAATAASAEVGMPKRAQNEVAVRFGSYAMGIDRAAASRIEEIVAAEPSDRKVAREGAGREGEYVLTVHVGTAADARRLQERLTAAVPAKPHGPISIEGPLGTINRPST